jgi:flagellar M-ring protein FliF
MNEFFRQLGNDGMRIWSQMSMTQRVLVGAVGASTIGLFLFLIVWAQQPQYTVLFSKLSDQDAGAIVAKLREGNIPYQLEGNSIKVPAANVHEARLDLASEGLPSGGTVGFQELFSGNNFGATDFTNKLNYQRGLEGELARTIGTIEGVEKARVHIVIPKESLFIEDEQETSASVLLTVAPGTKLELPQVRTIQHLVAKAVPNLKQDSVFVTDTAGRDYTEEMAKNDPKNLAGTDLSARHLEIKRKYEREMERRIQAMLDPMLGTENSVVRVSTSWDFSQIETNAEVYTPSVNQGGLLLSEKGKRESYNGQIAGADGGVPGTNPNVAPDYQAAADGNNGNYTNDEYTRNYNNNKEVQRRIKEPAVLRDTTISVAFNPPAELNPAGRQRMADQLARQVAAAAGISMADYQNKVFVNPMPFNTAGTEAAAAADAERARQQALIKWGTVAGAIALSILAFILLLASFRRRRQDELAQIEEALPKLPSDDLGITLIDDDAELLSRVDELQNLPPATPDEQRLADIQKELLMYIKAQPKDAAKLVKAWMIEDE